MPRSTDTSLSNPAHSVRASVLPAQLPDDPAALKALLFAQQRAFEAQLVAQFETLRLEQESAFSARELEQRKAFEVREAEQKKAFEMREAELQKAFEARILEIYEQLRLARRRMFGPSSESHAGQGWLFNEAEALVESAPHSGDTATLPPPATETSGDAPAETAKNKVRGKRKPLPVELPRIELIHDVPQTERTCSVTAPAEPGAMSSM